MPSADQIVGIPWWLWLVILLALLILLVAGFLGRGNPGFLYPNIQESLPQDIDNQVSSGTELESVVKVRSPAAEELKPTATLSNG